jgi:hypothetical protein
VRLATRVVPQLPFEVGADPALDRLEAICIGALSLEDGVHGHAYARPVQPGGEAAGVLIEYDYESDNA